MTSIRKFKSETFAAIHDAAGDLFEVGAMTKTTMREFDAPALRRRPRLLRRTSHGSDSTSTSANRCSRAT